MEKWNYEEFRAKQQTFSSSDGQIKYVDQGEGDVIVLLHGVPSSSWLYRKMIPGLVADGHRVIAPDMLGFGNSDSPDGYELYAPDQHAKRLVELMDSLKIQTWTHVMHDAGGLWTWELMKKAPDRVSNLVILNTIIFETGFTPPIRMEPGAFGKFSMWLYRNRITSKMMLKQLFKKTLKEDNLSKSEVEGYHQPLREGKTKAMYYFFAQTCNNLPLYDDVFAEMQIPVAVVWGQHDDMLQWDLQDEQVIKALGVKNENIHVVDGKHFIQEELPDTINNVILNMTQHNRPTP